MTFDELFQYYANMGFGTQNVPQQTQEGIASLITPAVSGVTPVIPRGGDEYRGGGLFGNLDLSKAKTFTKDVYSDVLGPPGAFEFSPQEIQAYYNPTLGNYQTYEGLNVNPMFSNTGATFGLAGLFMDMMGLTPKTVGGFVPQSIRGYYDTPKDFWDAITGKTKRAEEQKELEFQATAERDFQQQIAEAEARQSAIAQEAANREAARNRGGDGGDRGSSGGAHGMAGRAAGGWQDL